MSLERTIYIVKPEAFDRRAEIKEYIEQQENFTVTECRTHTMVSADVEQLYGDDLGTELLDAAKQHLVGKEVEVCVVRGENAVEQFLDLAGRHFDNRQCEPHTIRRRFGQAITLKYGNVTYYLNAIHKTTGSEVQKALAWFEKLKK